MFTTPNRTTTDDLNYGDVIILFLQSCTNAFKLPTHTQIKTISIRRSKIIGMRVKDRNDGVKVNREIIFSLEIIGKIVIVVKGCSSGFTSFCLQFRFTHTNQFPNFIARNAVGIHLPSLFLIFDDLVIIG